MSLVSFLQDNASKITPTGKIMYSLVEEDFSTSDVYESDFAGIGKGSEKEGKGYKKGSMSMEDSLAAKVVMERFLTADGTGVWEFGQ